MSRLPPVLAAVLLVVAGAVPLAVAGGVTAPAQPADDPVVGVSENTTRVLLLTEADAAAFESPNATVTSALAAGSGVLDAQFQLERVDRKLTSAATDAARRAVLENATEWAEARLHTLQERERTARVAFASGDTTASQYVVTLGRIHAEAESLSDVLRGSTEEPRLYQFASEFGDIQRTLSQLQVQTALLRGPVRERVAEVIHGERDRFRLHVTAGNGVMFSTLDGDEYVHETVRSGNLDDATGGSIGEGSNAIERLYPWMTNHTEQPALIHRGNYAYDYTTGHDHGTITAYVDATTEKVYAEYQQLDLSALPVEVEASTSANNTTLNVSRTYAGGPLNVRVENATGAPVDAPVYVNGTEVGTAGADDGLWTLSPAGAYNVSTVHNGTRLDVNVTAAPVP